MHWQPIQVSPLGEPGGPHGYSKQPCRPFMIFGLRIGIGQFCQPGWIAPIGQLPQCASVQRNRGRERQPCPRLAFGDRFSVGQHRAVPALGSQPIEGGKEGVAPNVGPNTCHVPVTCKPFEILRYRRKMTPRAAHDGSAPSPSKCAHNRVDLALPHPDCRGEGWAIPKTSYVIEAAPPEDVVIFWNAH
jgi:hypothetical protein